MPNHCVDCQLLKRRLDDCQTNYDRRFAFYDNRLRQLEHRGSLFVKPLPTFKTQSTSSKIVVALWTLACLGGLFYQTYYLTAMYLRYDISVELWMYPKFPLKPPQITIFIGEYQKQCFEQFRSIFKPGYTKCITKQTVDERIKNMTKFGEMMNELFYVDGQGKSHSLNRKSSPNLTEQFVGEIFSRVGQSFTIDLDEISYPQQVVEAASSFMFVSIELFENANIYYAIGQPGEVRDPVKLGSKLKRHGTGHELDITYIKTQISLQPPPYTTMCRDYATEGLKGGQNECYHECIIKSRLQNRTLGAHDVVTPYLYEKYLAGGTFAYTQEAIDPPELKSQCREQCSQRSCYMELFEWTETVNTIRSNSSFNLRLGEQSRPTLEANYVPRMYFIEYATFVSSLFGFWFGVSIISAKHGLLSFARKLC